MSHAACAYVKHLVQAPNGERITVQEKCVLSLLADEHREETGVAWPSMKTLAKRACLSERSCRRIIAGLERKGVVARIPNARERDGGQTSNEYLFPQLDTQPRSDAQLEVNRRKLQKTPRTRMTGGGGHTRPGVPDKSVLPPRTPVTGAPGQPCPPIDPSLDPSTTLSGKPLPDEHHRTPTPPSGRGIDRPVGDRKENTAPSSMADRAAERKEILAKLAEVQRKAEAQAKAAVMPEPKASTPQDAFDRLKLRLKDDLKTAALQVRDNRFPSLGESQYGETDHYDACFRDWWLVSAELDDVGAEVWYTEAAQPDVTQAGLIRFAKRIDRILRSILGRKVPQIAAPRHREAA